MENGIKMEFQVCNKFFWVSLVALACAPSDTQRNGQPAVRDSAGITIVENTSHGWEEGTAWRVSEPALVIGAADGPADYQFFNVTGTVLLRGKILVANAGTQELRSFDLQGSYQRTTGRRGEGPGEFVDMGALRRYRRDSLLVFDKFERHSPFGDIFLLVVRKYSVRIRGAKRLHWNDPFAPVYPIETKRNHVAMD